MIKEKFLVILFFLCIGFYSTAKPNKTKHIKRYSQKTKTTSTKKHKFDVDIAIYTPSGYGIELNTQNMTTNIVDDPYLEYEQIQDANTPNLNWVCGITIPLKKFKKTSYKIWRY